MKDKNKAVVVVAGILKKEGKILIARPKKINEPSELWEFPGGKAEEKESELQALKREFKEELGIKIETGELVGTVPFTLPKGKKAVLKAYNVEFLEGNIILKVHEEIRFIPYSELGDYSFTEPDRPIVELIEKSKLADIIQHTIDQREQGHPQKALKSFMDLRDIHSDSAEIPYQIAWTLQSLGDEGKAVSFYVEALDKGLKGERRRDTWLILIYTFINADEVEEAMKYLSLLEKESGEGADLLFFKSIALIKQDKKEEALSCLFKIIRDYPKTESLSKYRELLDYFIENWK